MRRILKRLQVPLPYETSFNAADNPYTESEFLKICENYRVPNDPMKYWDEKLYWTYQRSVGWPNNYIGPDSMTRWIIEKSVGFTDVGLLRISESVRAYAYLILSSQASARSSIIGNSASSLTAQSAFLNNFENVVNRKVDIQEDVKRYQETLSYALSKVDYSVGENHFMLPTNMELRIRSGTVGYNNKILVSDAKFNMGKNDEVNSLKTPAIETNSLETPAIKNHKINFLETPAIESHLNTAQGLTHASAISHGREAPAPPAHEDEKAVFIILLTGGFTVSFLFR